MKVPLIFLIWLAQATVALESAAQAQRPNTTGRRIVAAAEAHLGKAYVFGGRDGRPGCLRSGKRVRCPRGIDCQSLIFFAYEQVFHKAWTRFSVMPSICVARNQLGLPVPGLDGVLRARVNRTRLRAGDVLFFLLEDYNLDADPALVTRDGVRYGVWHTGLVHSREGDRVRVIHAKPGERVLIEGLSAIAFDALFVVRWPEDAPVKRKPRR